MKRESKKSPVNISPGFYLYYALLFLLLPVHWVLALAASAVVHEMGHLAALWLMRVPVEEIRIGSLGVILQTPPMEPGKELFCAAAGPVCGLCLVFLFRWAPELALFAVFHSLYNLLPVYPADGGRIFSSLCKWLMPVGVEEKVAKTVGFITALLLAVVGLYGTFIAKLGLLPAAVGVAMSFRGLKNLK